MTWHDGPGFRLRHPRLMRFVPAALVAVLAALLAVPILVAAEPTRHVAMPETFSVPAPFPGDKATYDYRLEQDTLLGTRVRVRIPSIVNWTVWPPDWARRPDGNWTPANVVDYREKTLMLGDGVIPVGAMPEFSGASYETAANLRFYAAQGLVPLGGETRRTLDDATVSGNGHTFRSVRWLNTTWWGSWLDDPRFFRAGLCGIGSPFQGSERRLDQEVVLADGCWAAGAPVSSTAFKAMDAEERDGDLCVRFQQSADSEGRRVSILLCGDVPYPARIEVEHLEFQDYRSVYELVGFERGQHAAPRADAPPPWRDLDGTFGPANPWGPDDADINSSFPLSEAFGLVTHSENATIRDFLSDEPDAFVRWARPDAEAPEDAWVVTFQARSERLGVTVTRAGAMNVSRAQIGVSPPTWSSVRPIDRLPTAGAVLDLFRELRPARVVLDPTTYRFERDYTDGRCIDLYPGSTFRGAEFHSCALVPRIGAEAVRESSTTRPDGTNITDSLEFSVATDANQSAVSSFEHHMITLVGPAPPGSATARDGPAGAAPAIMRIDAPDFQPDRRIVWAAGIGLLVGALYWIFPFAKHGLALALFSRIERPRALEHPARQALVDIIHAEPGIHFTELVQRAGRPRTVVEHHLRKLLRVGLIQQTTGAGLACYFPTGLVDRRVMNALPFAKSESAARLLGLVTQTPSQSSEQLARAVGLDPATVSYHVKRLRREGLLTATRDGRNIRLSPTPIAAPTLRLVRVPAFAPPP